MEHCSWAIESGWTWTGASTTTKDTWTEIWGDGADAAVENIGAAIKSFEIKIYINTITLKQLLIIFRRTRSALERWTVYCFIGIEQ